MNNFFYRNAVVTIGCILCAVAINVFYIPNKLLSGGISGLAFLVYYLAEFPFGMTNIILNIPCFYLAWKYMDKEYVFGSLYGMLVFSFATDFLLFLTAYTPNVPDKMLSCITGGVIYGIGCGLIYRVGGGSGGMDIIGSIIYKYYGISNGTVNFLFNIILMIACTIAFGLEAVLYTVVTFFVVFKITNTFTIGFDYKKNIIIISDKHEEIARGIIEIVGRGVTYLHGQGAYTHQERKILFVVAKLTQVARIKQIVNQNDSHAFMIIQDTNDVFGKGFTVGMDKMTLPNKSGENR